MDEEKIPTIIDTGLYGDNLIEFIDIIIDITNGNTPFIVDVNNDWKEITLRKYPFNKGTQERRMQIVRKLCVREDLDGVRTLLTENKNAMILIDDIIESIILLLRKMDYLQKNPSSESLTKIERNREIFIFILKSERIAMISQLDFSMIFEKIIKHSPKDMAQEFIDIVLSEEEGGYISALLKNEEEKKITSLFRKLLESSISFSCEYATLKTMKLYSRYQEYRWCCHRILEDICHMHMWNTLNTIYENASYYSLTPTQIVLYTKKWGYGFIVDDDLPSLNDTNHTENTEKEKQPKEEKSRKRK